jgi:predicted GNAT family acetyltransferase
MKLAVNKKGEENEEVSRLTGRDYKYLKEFDYFFVIHKEDEVVASASLIYENEHLFEINDVKVEEKYRGNNYSVLLLMNILYYMESGMKIKISCERTNNEASCCYRKVFGEPWRVDERYNYFSLNLE